MNNLILSVEKINDLSICPTLYSYKHLLRKTPAEKPDYLVEGELIHEGLRIYYQSIIDNQRIGLPALIELTRNYASKLNISVSSVEQTIKDLTMYVNYYGNSESWQIEAAEEPFAKVLYEDNTLDLRVIINGKTDLRIKTNYGKGPRVIVDHKYEGEFRSKQDRDNQALTYSWAYETRDWIYNRIGKQKTYKPEQRLQRPYFNYTDTQVEEWRESTLDLIMDLIRYERNSKFPMRYTGCSFHGKKCTFYDICNTTPDNREYKLNQLFLDRDSSKTVMER